MNSSKRTSIGLAPPAGRRARRRSGAACARAGPPSSGPMLLEVDAVAGESGRVGDHGHHRRRHRHRVAVGDDEGRVGERLEQGWELLEVLGRLEHPACAAPQPLEHLEDLAQVGVGGSLVARQVEVPPGRHGSGRLEEHRREVDRQQLNLLVRVLDRHLVHAVEVRQGCVQERERQRRALLAGVGRVRARAARARRAPARGSPSRGATAGRGRRTSGCAGAWCPSGAARR